MQKMQGTEILETKVMPKHIVTTDDDPAIRKILQTILMREGYDVTACKDGSELTAVLRRKSDKIDLILLDIKMPGLSGIELLELIQKQYPFVPIVMLTAFSDLDTGMKTIRLGASDYLAKPVSRVDLLNCVERVISKTEKDYHEVAEKSQYMAYQKELEQKLNEAHLSLKNTTLATLEAFSETIEQTDPYTKGHCSRVRSIAVQIGRTLRLNKEQLVTLEGGSLLHDIGKIGISELLLNKPARLSKEEYEIIKMHPVAGEKIINHIELFSPYQPIIRSHHERFDGSGYPDGLKGDQIPLLVRIVALADAFDAMTSSRAYRSALPTEIAVEQIKLCSGTQFDPAIVDLFIDKEIFLL
jgi:putative two-component system response regulator